MATFLRRHEELPDETVVVKGGLMARREKLEGDAEDLYIKYGVYGVSVVARPGLTGDEILDSIPACKVPHAKVRETTAAQLREIGCDAVPSLWEGHATLTLPRPLTDDDWDNLKRTLAPPRRNPVGK